MPIYEYVCDACSHEFEKLQKFSDPPAKKCPECSGKVSRKLSASAFHLRGGGWYSDGYGKNGNGASKSGAGESGKKETGSPPAGSDSGNGKSKGDQAASA